MKNDYIREKATMFGEAMLSEMELVCVLIGCKEGVAISLLLQQMESTSIGELQTVKGIGKATALKLKAALEIARRSKSVLLHPGEVLNNSRQVFAHFHERLKAEKREKFFSLLLDSKHRVIREELVSIGSLNFSIVHPREVFALAIRESAESILLVHNHPSGDPTPSQEDIQVTKRLREVGKIVGIEVIDHIIIGDGCYVSFIEQKLF